MLPFFRMLKIQKQITLFLFATSAKLKSFDVRWQRQPTDQRAGIAVIRKRLERQN
jgi:hypothetical protein